MNRSDIARTRSSQMIIPILILALISNLASCKKEEDRVISYSDLVGRLIDLQSLAILPNEGEKSAMWSSYDRDSKIDTATGEFINWDANIDGLRPQYIRKEGDKEVLADMIGPGAIVRIWSASPRKGKVQVFIDGKEEPVINESFIDYFKPSIAAFNYPELVYETNARGFNNYVPIPYQKSCKIVAEPGWGQYYHFNYITFPDGTELEPFDPALTESGKQSLEQVNAFFAQKMGTYPHKEDLNEEVVTVEIEPGGKKDAFLFSGSGAIATLRAKLNDVNDTAVAEILRKTVLEVRWDGEESPSVWTPLGDFFGTSPGWNEYKTLPMGMTKEWMYSYWFMPYGDGAKISIVNHYSHDVSITLELQKKKLEGNINDYGRFHAKWHRDLNPLEESRWPDWTLLKTKGKGRFLGAHLLVWNPKGGSAEAGGPGYWWWGEGDEKFFIDDEQFPSTFGTGTEDYFGYAWCDPSVFEQAFHSQTLDNDNMGYQPMNRWQIIDNIPFQKSFDGYLEKYFPNETPTQYSTVVYWYLDPKGEDLLTGVDAEELYGYEIPFEVFRREGVLEMEKISIVGNSGGWATNDIWANEKLFKSVSGHKILQWTVEKNKENKLKTTFELEKEGGYGVYANIIKQEDGGEFDVQMNGEILARIDCSALKGAMQTEKVMLGRIRLQPGEQQIEFGWSGKDEFPKTLRVDYMEFKEIY